MAPPLSSRELIRMQLGLERIGLGPDGILSRLPGEEPDDMGLAYVIEPAGEAPFLALTKEVKPETALKIKSKSPRQWMDDPGSLAALLGSGMEASVFVGGWFETPVRVEDPDLRLGKAERSRADIFSKGKVVSTCESVRRNGQAEEAWVYTPEKFRRKGYGLRAVLGWAERVQAEGRVAFYSHERGNEASRNLAKKAGVMPFAKTLVVSQKI